MNTTWSRTQDTLHIQSRYHLVTWPKADKSYPLACWTWMCVVEESSGPAWLAHTKRKYKGRAMDWNPRKGLTYYDSTERMFCWFERLWWSLLYWAWCALHHAEGFAHWFIVNINLWWYCIGAGTTKALTFIEIQNLPVKRKQFFSINILSLLFVTVACFTHICMHGLHVMQLW